MNLRQFILSSVALFFAVMSAQAQEIDLKLRNTSVKKAMEQLQKSTGYSFVYISDDVDTKKMVSVDASSLSQAVEQILAGQNVSFEIQGNNIVVKKGSLNSVSVASDARTVVVSGTVRDSEGYPLPGANVVSVADSKLRTVTDMDGRFEFSVPVGSSISINYIGFIPATLKAQANLEVSLKEDTQTLDEVVVVGYGQQKKVNLTGAVGTVDSKAFESRPVTSALQALQGVVPGLQISSNTGAMDSDMSVNVRGVGTIGEGSSGAPLILIDGMEGDINTINPQDIENISVLKDASSASIYGSRAPFGVILVTTKNGRAGKTTLSYTNNFNISSPLKMPHMMDSYTFAQYMNQASQNDGGGIIFGEDLMRKMLDFQAGKISGGVPASSNGQWGKPDYDPYTFAYANTDWYDEVYKDNVFSMEHNVSLNGGTEKTSYYVSLNYLNQNGLLRHGDDGMNRLSFTGKLSAQLTSWAKLNISTRMIRKNVERPTAYNGWFLEMFDRLCWPNLPVYDPNGYYFNNNSTNVAMVLAEGGDRKSTRQQYYYQGTLILEPVKNWVTNVDFNYSSSYFHEKETSFPTYNHDVDGNVINTNGSTYLWEAQTRDEYWNLNAYSTYSLSLNESHNFKVMVGMQMDEMNQKYFSAMKYGLMDNGMPEFDLTTGTDGRGNEISTTLNGYKNSWSTVGFFGRINYDYKSRYLLEVNLRHDGTSRFRRGNRWRTSPSASIGWNIANEQFMEPTSSWLNILKLRGSYGVLGNQNTSNWYPTYRVMNLNPYRGSWLQNGARPNVSSVGDLISSYLTWEKVRTWNLGLDFGLFNNRLSGNFDIYTRYTDNMVGPAIELPSTLGAGVPATNNCDLKTEGWELSLTWRDRPSNDFSYSVGVSLSDARTIIRSYPGNTTGALDNYIAGHEINEIWGFETIGIAKTDAEMQAHLDRVGGQDALGYNWGAGDIMYADLDGKPGITQGGYTDSDKGDLKLIGNSTPRYFFGINLSAQWKGFDVSAFFQGVMKRDYWAAGGTFWGIDTGMWYSSGLKQHADYFRSEDIGIDGHIIPANLDSYYPRPAMYSGTKNHYKQTRYLQDASYIRLKNLQVGYSLPQKVIRKVGLTKCRVYVSGENLWTGTSLSSLYDPETLSGGFKGRGNGYPLSRTWSFGLNINF